MRNTTRRGALRSVTLLVALLLAVLIPPVVASAEDERRDGQRQREDARSSMPIELADQLCSDEHQVGVSVSAAGASSDFTSSGDYSHSYPAWHAFDDDPSTRWLSRVWESPAVLGIELDAPTAVTAYEIRFSNGPSLTTRAPKTFRLEGSDDNRTWTTVDSHESEVDWLGSQTRAYDVSSPAWFGFYRLVVDSDNDERSEVVVASVGDLRLYRKCRFEPDPVTTAFAAMTFNIGSQHWCVQAGGCLYDDPNFALDAVADLIVDNNIDVAGIQEIERNTNRHGGVDMIQLLADKLEDRGYPMTWHFEAWTAMPGGMTMGEFGIAIFTRLPEVSYDALFYPSSVLPAYTLPIQNLVVDVAGEHVRVFNLHAMVQGSCDQITPGLVDVMADYLDESTVLLGDFNDPLFTPCMQQLQLTHAVACVESAHPECDSPFSVPLFHPNYDAWGVDWVLYRFSPSSGAALVDAWFDHDINDLATTYPGPNWVSDHYPKLAFFELTSEG